MKKTLFSLLFVCGLFYSGSAYITMYGIYKSAGPNSFYCMMISRNFCARIQEPPDEGQGPQWPTFITTYNPDGVIMDRFAVKSFHLRTLHDVTQVTYELP